MDKCSKQILFWMLTQAEILIHSRIGSYSVATDDIHNKTGLLKVPSKLKNKKNRILECKIAVLKRTEKVYHDGLSKAYTCVK